MNGKQEKPRRNYRGDKRDSTDRRGARDKRNSTDRRGLVHGKVIEETIREDQVEGRNPVLEVFRSGRTVDKLLIARGSREGSIREIIRKAKDKGIVIQEVDRKRLDDLSLTEGAHQGVIAFVTPYSYVEIEDILKRASEKGEAPFIIVLDEITDPHNLGSVIRTAECCGAHGVIIPKRRAVGLTPGVIKASAGAVEFVLISKVTNISDTLDILKEKGLWIAGADMEGELYTSKDLTGPFALVVGSEGKGIGRLVKQKCDFLVKIPMKGKISSLNASVATGVVMYEVARQRDKG
ncbi:MAG TPA: 23S rRNA (guanosine(2251)-2'-O)-methyltransferase RlmB [Clostridia bacterium]|nr:23S rRNA (guanosine(2251)-2'-O)-methyltransferase RlmB [Clostridia bacterium]